MVLPPPASFAQVWHRFAYTRTRPVRASYLQARRTALQGNNDTKGTPAQAAELAALFAAEVAEAVAERQVVGGKRALATAGGVGEAAEGKAGKAEGEAGEVEGEAGKVKGAEGEADNSGDIVFEAVQVDVEATAGIGEAAGQGQEAQHRAGEGRRGEGDGLLHGCVGSAAAAATSSSHSQVLAREAATDEGAGSAARTLSATDGAMPTFEGPADASAAAQWAALRSQALAGAWQAGAREPAVRAARLRQRAWLEADAFGTIMQWLYSRIPDTRGDRSPDVARQR